MQAGFNINTAEAACVHESDSIQVATELVTLSLWNDNN